MILYQTSHPNLRLYNKYRLPTRVLYSHRNHVPRFPYAQHVQYPGIQSHIHRQSVQYDQKNRHQSE